MLENIGNFMTRLLMDRLERNLGGRIQTTPLPQNRYWSLLLTAQCMHCAVLCPVLWGVMVKKTSTHLMKLCHFMPLCYK